LTKRIKKVKKSTEQYKLELEEINLVNNTNIKLKEGVELNNLYTKIIHICSCGKEWSVKPNNILSGNSKKCGLCYTFAECGIDNLGINFLKEYWDYEKNKGIDPWKISYASEIYVYIFCKKVDYHGSYPIMCKHFSKGNRCGYCKGDKLVHPKDSFGQFLIDSFGDNVLEMYWDYKVNNIDPFTITKRSNKMVYIKCQKKDYHGSYGIRCPDFVDGDRCGYCRGFKVHPLDSIGTLYPQSLIIWSDKNEKTPYEYTHGSNQEVWWKCKNGKHEDYPQIVCSTITYNFRCPECSREYMESNMATTLKQVFKHKYPDTIWEYDAGFRTNKNGISRYDIYVPNLNLLIECQSEYHDNEIRKARDKLKKQFALDNNYNFIELDYRDYSPLEAVQMFFPHIKEIPKYVDFTKDTIKNWDVKKAQKLLNEGHTFMDVANEVGTTYGAIHSALLNKGLIKPKNYQIQGEKIVCINKNNELIKIYNSVSSAAKDLGKANGTSISSCLTKKPRSDTGKIRETAFGFKWMYLVDYENMVKDQNNKPP